MAYDDNWYLHPKLKPILKDTYGVILYQEQVLSIAKEMCGYTLGQADVLRRIIGRKQVDQMEEVMKEFVQRGINNNIPEITMIELCRQITTFAEYSFNKGHSTAYSYLSYQTAFLKANYPLEFMCSLINSEGNKQENILPYIVECKRLGIKVLPPDIIKSNYEWIIEGTSIRVGLSYIKNLGHVELIRDSDFTSFINQNSGINKKMLEALIKSGCFGDYNISLAMAQLHWKKVVEPRIVECKSKIEFYTQSGKQGYLSSWQGKLEALEAYPEDVEEEEFNRNECETEYLGFSFNEKLDDYNISIAKPYSKTTNMEQVIFGEVVKFKEWKTKKGKIMYFVTVRTYEDTVEPVMFNRIATKYGLLELGKVYLLSMVETQIVGFQKAILK